MTTSVDAIQSWARKYIHVLTIKTSSDLEEEDLETIGLHCRGSARADMALRALVSE
jgi:hypothetical protein